MTFLACLYIIWYIKCSTVAICKGHPAVIVTTFWNDHNCVKNVIFEVPRDGFCFNGTWKLVIFSKRLARKFWYTANILHFLPKFNTHGVRSIVSGIRPPPRLEHAVCVFILVLRSWCISRSKQRRKALCRFFVIVPCKLVISLSETLSLAKNPRVWLEILMVNKKSEFVRIFRNIKVSAILSKKIVPS